MVLNADGTAGIAVEMVDELFAPLAKFSGDDAGHVTAQHGQPLPRYAVPRGSSAHAVP